jgi:formamidopyrimidine-DNA glycosylase
MDQQRVAGIGNLLADEILWRAGVDPARPSRDLDADAVRRLHRTIRTVLRDLMKRGGSHLGELQPERDGVCPRRSAAATAHDWRSDHLFVPRAPAMTGPTT